MKPVAAPKFMPDAWETLAVSTDPDQDRLEIIDNTLQEAKSEDLGGWESFFTRIDAIFASDNEFPSLFFKMKV